MSTEPSTAPKKLLIVDDSKISRMRIHAHFSTNFPDWDIREAVSGDEALELIATFVPNFITMDVNMPGISGFEAVTRLQALNLGIRIVMFTANIQENSRQMATTLNVGFVAKPPTQASLMQAQTYLLG